MDILLGGRNTGIENKLDSQMLVGPYSYILGVEAKRRMRIAKTLVNSVCMFTKKGRPFKQ